MSLLKRLCLLLLALLLLAAIIGGGWLWWDYRRKNPVIREVPRQGGLDVTLCVVTDPHFGAPAARGGPRTRNDTPVTPMPALRRIDTRMRSLAGTPWPVAIGGKVGQSSALIMPGDLTEDGKRAEWAAYAEFYGLHPSDPTRDRSMPVLECHGNHDLHETEDHGGTHVTERIAARHGHTHYGKDFGDLRVISLGAGPDHEVLNWLYRDLAATGQERPVVLFMHYPLLGPWSGTWFGWNHTVTERFHHIVRQFNVVAILHGHYHRASRYTWRGIDVYNVGSVKHGCHSFGVMRVTDDHFALGCWNTDLNGWWWWHAKPINRTHAQTAAPVSGIARSKGSQLRPNIPDPIDRWCQTDRQQRQQREKEERRAKQADGIPWLPFRRR